VYTQQVFTSKFKNIQTFFVNYSVCTQTDTGEPVCISGTKPPKKKKKNKKKKKGNPFKKQNISNFQDLRLEFDAWCIDDNICMVPNYFLKCNFSRKGITEDFDPKSSVLDLDLDPVGSEIFSRIRIQVSSDSEDPE
jgi:hypothetical protein